MFSRETLSRAMMLAATLILLAGTQDGSHGQAAEVEIRPIMQVNGSEIRACGVALRLKHPVRDFEMMLVNEKEDGGTRVVLRTSAQRPGKAGAKHEDASLVSAVLTTADISTSRLLKLSPADDAQQIEAWGRPSPSNIAILFQQLLVGGADISIATSKASYQWKVQGPAPQSVRAAYLMCSGDLFVPDTSTVVSDASIKSYSPKQPHTCPFPDVTGPKGTLLQDN